jgi:CRISPR associated protein Cas1
MDAKSRASIALDLMEPVRSAVERYVLDLICTRTFRRGDFAETADGHVWLLTPLTLELAETMPAWANEVAPWAERVAHTLGRVIAGKWSPTAPLTGARRRLAQAKVRERRSLAFRQLANRDAHHQRPDVAAGLALAATCQECGNPIPGRFRRYCPSCGVLVPGQDKESRRRRAQAISARRADLEAWKRSYPDEPANIDYFREYVVPRLKTEGVPNY